MRGTLQVAADASQDAVISVIKSDAKL